MDVTWDSRDGFRVEIYKLMQKIFITNLQCQILIKQRCLLNSRYWFGCFPQFTPQITYNSDKFNNMKSEENKCSTVPIFLADFVL